MRQRLSLIAAVAAVLLSAGCGSPKPILYYSVHIPATPAPTSHTYAVNLTVSRLAGPDLLEAAPIIFQTGRNEIGTYQYHRWEEAPVEMVQAKLIRLLKASGQYRAVGEAGSSPYDLQVRGRLYDFTEVDGDAITGLVTMEFELYNRKTGQVLWSHFYSQTEPVEAKKIPAVVSALDRNLDRGLKEVVAGLGAYFAGNQRADAGDGRNARN